jgi:hypothetical protein
MVIAARPTHAATPPDTRAATSAPRTSQGAPEDSKGPFYYPTGPGVWRVRVIAGASMDVLPRRLVEAEQREVPKVTGGLRWGLPYGVSLEGRISAIVLSNEVQGGIGWSWGSPSFAFEVYERVGVWFGTLGVEGFDATGMGILNTPGLALGVPMREVRFTLGVEALVVHSQAITVGDTTLRRNHLSFAGLAFPLTVESMLPGGGAFYYGLTVVWAKPDYQLWLAFSDSEQRQAFPRFVAGYEF